MDGGNGGIVNYNVITHGHTYKLVVQCKFNMQLVHRIIVFLCHTFDHDHIDDVHIHVYIGSILQLMCNYNKTQIISNVDLLNRNHRISKRQL